MCRKRKTVILFFIKLRIKNSMNEIEDEIEKVCPNNYNNFYIDKNINRKKNSELDNSNFNNSNVKLNLIDQIKKLNFKYD